MIFYSYPSEVNIPIIKSCIVIYSWFYLKLFKTSIVQMNKSAATRSVLKSTVNFFKFIFYTFKLNYLPFSSICKISLVLAFKAIKWGDWALLIAVVNTTFLRSTFLVKWISITWDKSKFVKVSAYRTRKS